LRLTPNFTLSELVTQGKPDRESRWDLVTPHRLASLVTLASTLQAVRDIVRQPIRVTSGLRAGNGKSQHHHGQAADVQIDGMSPLELLAIMHDRRLLLPGLRQVIAETTRGTGALRGPMGEGSGRWVHIAILGPGFGRTDNAWLTSADGQTYSTWRA